MIKIPLPEKVNMIIHRLQKAGYEAYAVGGCVRDSLLGRTPEDWDITTLAKPEQVKALFSHTIDTGIEHGTVTVMLDHEGFEVTTYRIDGEYEDARHPKQVEFTPLLSLDLQRRDFTINAMAYNEEDGIVDLFGGMEDMKNHLIRCVGNANERFDEDALRIMRAVRFCAQLDFAIEPDTLRAVASHAAELSRISAERIRVELTKLLLSDHPERLLIAHETGLTAVFLPEFDRMLATPQENPHHIYDVGMHTMHALSYIAERTASCRTQKSLSEAETSPATTTGAEAGNCHGTEKGFSSASAKCTRPFDSTAALSRLDKKTQTALRYAILLHDSAKPDAKTVDENGKAHFFGHDRLGAELSKKILRRLKFDNDTIQTVSHLVALHDIRYADPGAAVKERTMRRAINRIGKDYLDLLFLLQEADLHAQNPALLPDKLRQLDEARRVAEKILREEQCVSLKDLAVSGTDLIAAGFAPGRKIGEILASLLDYVLEYPEYNKKELLLERAKLYEPAPANTHAPERPNPQQPEASDRISGSAITQNTRQDT